MKVLYSLLGLFFGFAALLGILRTIERVILGIGARPGQIGASLVAIVLSGVCSREAVRQPGK